MSSIAETLETFAPREGAEPIGATVLQNVHAFLGRFVAYPSPEAHTAHTLWCAHAHLMDAWESTPRLAFLSPEPGSGKTRALEITELLVPRPKHAANMSPSALFRSISAEEGPPTILLDEVDAVFAKKSTDPNQQDMRGLLNAGHRRGATVTRCVPRGRGIDIEDFPTYAAAALAGLGDLPDTLMSRSIVIRMRRRAPNERVEPFRLRFHGPEGERLRVGLEFWASWLAGIGSNIPDLPDGVSDRAADCWEPLIAIADAAGGDWPERARVSCVSLVSQSQGYEGSLGVKLLTDLRTVFGDETSLPTERILKALHAMDESPWGDLHGHPLDARGLAKRLKPYSVQPRQIRTLGSTAKGYRREDLWDAWRRYLPSSSFPPESETSETSETTDCQRCHGEGCLWCEK